MIRQLASSSFLMMFVVASARRQIGSTHQCPDICPAIYNPVCGSDGKIYSSPCRLNAASCKVGYAISRASFETCGGSTQQCPDSCPTIFSPVCGTDGNIYSSLCRLYAVSCLAGFTLTQAPFSNCEESPNIPPPCPEICTAIYDPVCGSDGKTYSSECGLLAASCKAGNTIAKVSNGKCSNGCPNFCPLNYDPVCGSDGTTYSNDCHLNIAICRNNVVTKASDGQCPPKIKCPFGCSKIYSAVCGTDGKTYSNECRLRTVTCVNSTVRLAYVGPCVKCPSCPKNYEPVCGSDGNTYNNRCLLKVATCKNPSISIKVAYDGRCRNRH